VVLTLGKIADLQRASLKDSCSCDGEILESVRAFGNGGLAVIQRRNEAATKLLYFGECVGLTTLVRDDNLSTLLDADLIRLEVPVGIGCAGTGFGEQILQSGGEAQRRKSDVLAEVRAESGVRVRG